MVPGLEVKFAGGAPILSDGHVIEGYASLFGLTDQGGDAVMRGAFAASLAKLSAKGDKVRMLWQHDPAKPIGVWDEIREDEKGLWVKGRLLPDVIQAREAAALIQAGAIDGLSIGYRTIRAERDQKGRRALAEVELWEVSLVTFPMLPEAKVGRKEAEDLREMADLFAIAADALRND
ncbi:HK97 family phage prohead protease [Paracoccus homiensis]|uniref:Prohead serine protease domain-containing protein n=1 Tax=Paracoccus homiensis TaxID=364199 RepID=A0A1I0CBB9_9RHOB|nr:HK97 family phage prohead protease [Paracoccus homiensis]SET16839.1 prohead peptidase. Unknown type peptidase. MEROPS family U35 [Paracoccus homiensis]